ncbi:MAG: hypothetical protein IJG05_03360 [Solobacterium sp.]|nr:hypothetical protein [Solobacterium sp.]
MTYFLRLGRCVLQFDIEHPQVLDWFHGFLAEPYSDTEIIQAGEYEKKQYLEQFPGSAWNAYAEYKCLLNLASDAMMKYNQFLFPSAAVLIDVCAWRLSGPSGIGKSTQYSNLKKLFPDQIDIVSGDYPITSFEGEGITVYPSPWNGKENWGSMQTGKLRRIIHLEQGKQNLLSPVSPKDAVIRVYHQINTYAETEEQIHFLAKLEEQLITSVPIWNYQNTGDNESSRILYAHIMKEQNRRSA